MSIGVNLSSVNSDYWGGASYQRSFSFVFSLPPDSDQPRTWRGRMQGRPCGTLRTADAGKSDLCGRMGRDDCVSL